jgi:hypothetical protein
LWLALVTHRALKGSERVRHGLHRPNNVFNCLQSSDNISEGDFFLLGPYPERNSGSSTHGGQRTKAYGYKVVM